MPESSAARPRTFNVGCEYPVRRHGSDKVADFCNGPGCATVVRVEDAHGVHQLLDGNGRVIDLPCRRQAFDDAGRPALQLVNIHTGVEQQRLTGDVLLAGEWQLRIRAARQRPARAQSRPADSGVKIEPRHL